MTLTRRSLLGAAAGTLLVANLPAAAQASTSGDKDTLDRWISGRARAIATTDPERPLDDLESLRRAACQAAIVGLGESVHDVREQADLKERAVRVLVEQLHFRTLAWEEDWTTGYEIDRYLTTGQGDPVSLVGQMTGQWQSRQTVELFRRLRAFNARRHDPVRFIGVEYYYTGRLAYDAVDAYVADAAPGQLRELREHLEPIYPTVDDKIAYKDVYEKLDDKAAHIENARQVYLLVRALPHHPRDDRYSIAVHHARQILSFHEHYALEQNEQNVYREERAAENLRSWQRRTKHRVAYWAATPHTANAPDLTISVPGSASFRYPATGSHLRRWYGRRYLSIGFTLDHGVGGVQPGQTFDLPRPAPTWFEAPLGRQAHDHFILDLRRPRSAAARDWLSGPLTTRGLPWAGPTSTISGGSVAQWFDLLVHTQNATPLDALSRATPHAAGTR